MRYYSTNKRSEPVDFEEATIRGLAPDKGLYFPELIPQLHKDLLLNMEAYTNAEIAFQVISPYVGDTIPAPVLEQIVEETIDFDLPLVRVTDRIYSLELFHGPTLAFKDVGARFMSRCLGYFAKEKKEKVIVLVATSGDTGGAVAHGFYNVDGIEVVILYPSGKVSSVQEKQLTTLGHNIHALEIAGNFDDCQAMVKDIFTDEALNKKLFLTSANSINVARWLPQQFYYFFAWKQWQEKTSPPVISVPSGNFGNICAGLLAQRSGLPVKHFIGACNANDVVPQYFKTGHYQPRQAVSTISNAMDVGDPSNFERILEMFQQEPGKLRSLLSCEAITDEATKTAIKKVFEQEHYLMDPHGAVAWIALDSYLANNPGDKGIFLETAHPVKFYDVVEPVIQQQVDIPGSVKAQLDKAKQSTRMAVDSKLLEAFLLGLK